MIVLLGREYITSKEASLRYGYSIEWFRKRRFLKQGPEFIQLDDKGKVYYDLEKTDKWFKDHFKIDE